MPLEFAWASNVPLRFIAPQLASSADIPPEGEQLIHEIKHDGYRCQVLLSEGRCMS
jgi:ATP-dependent DNA ligase